MLSGHKCYTIGTIAINKATHLADKFSRLYEPNLPRLQASRRREIGEATARLLWWFDQNKAEQRTWTLLVTEGPLLIDGLEKWQEPLELK